MTRCVRPGRGRCVVAQNADINGTLFVMSLVVPAVLPSSRKDLEEKILFLSTAGIKRIQIDVVDGKFATPASWPYNAGGWSPEAGGWKEMLPHLERIAYEIDFMCFDAESSAEEWLTLGATRLTFHAETDTNSKRLLVSARRRFGHIVSFGLALNIDTDVTLVEKCLSEIEYVQFMGIAKIGRQGQMFDERVLGKIRTFHNRHPDMPIQVDGGVSLENAKKLLNAGATSLIVGSRIVNAKDPAKAVAEFEALQSPHGV